MLKVSKTRRIFSNAFSFSVVSLVEVRSIYRPAERLEGTLLAIVTMDWGCKEVKGAWINLHLANVNK